MTARIRPAVRSDLDAILALERETENAPHWPSEAYSEILVATSAAPQRCLVVAERAGAITGFAVASLAPDACSAELESVAVAAPARRAGIGRSLCEEVFRWCRCQGATEIILEVRASSNGAIELYTKVGFVEFARRPRYYRNPQDDAALMRLKLANRLTPGDETLRTRPAS